MHSIAFILEEKLRTYRIDDMTFLSDKFNTIKIYFPLFVPNFQVKFEYLLVCDYHNRYLFQNILYAGSNYTLRTTQLSYKSMVEHPQ